ncbi:MBL fold metallo-hydrolase [Paenibacillus thalictri]|uniref:MBL fold metallo-hydrolase n=1 Tax=Paenibacillus thalictri TaxID=2527873 RepID=A0A4Q9E250_9BACL|nr:MBL fold metallo-hydrolase [Paenibacillus thalictri]TBL81691.1 MBL fold metallo-hydrolase [Paenibacillus thalictri]
MVQSFVIQHTPEITQIKVPLPFPLRWVNSYAIRGSGGWTVIDPGLRTAEAESLWDTVLQSLGAHFEDIEQVVLTHHHPDHYGLAGYFQERSGAPVYLSSAGYDQTLRLWGAGQPMTSELLGLFERHGLDSEKLQPMREHMDGFIPSVSPAPRVTFMKPGEQVRLGDRSYAAIHTPGHAMGHLVFYDESEQIMFCGDHVLPQITPNVSYLPGGIDENPLDSFLRSLEEIGRYAVRKAYPGHREPFERFSERTADIIRHHHQRLEQMAAMLDVPKTAYEVCRGTFGDKLSFHQLRFALSETLAHLIYLNKQGVIEQTADQTGVIRYLKA